MWWFYIGEVITYYLLFFFAGFGLGCLVSRKIDKRKRGK
jgi:hypothetical protein